MIHSPNASTNTNNSSSIIIAPSLLSADFANAGAEVAALQEAGATHLHLDVMDGVFVPDITFGHKLIADVAKTTSLTLDTHLMVANPYHMLENFAVAGSDIITVHAEAAGLMHLHRTVLRIRELGKKAGIALNPATHESVLEYLLEYIDLVLVMTVNPGYGGQKFIPEMLQKVARVSEMIGNRAVLLEVDGGVNGDNIAALHKAGANMFVAGNYVFSGDYRERIDTLRTGAGD